MHRRYNFRDEYGYARVEKSDIKALRTLKMNQSERAREKFATILKNILMFGVPVLLSILMLLVLVMIYLIRPYSKVQNFIQTVCTVTRVDILNGTSASCSAGTDPFNPCVKVYVSYNNGSSSNVNYGVLMENEQALFYCNPCSYTFGSHGLLHQPQSCDSWKEDFNPLICVQQFLKKYGNIGSTFICFFNPDNSKQVVRELIVSTSNVVHSVIWPTIFCVLYGLGCIFVSYNHKQVKILDKLVLSELREKERLQEIARIQASEWKKQRMNETMEMKKQLQNKLGTALGARISHVNGTMDRNTKRISCSLPSLHSTCLDEPESIADSDSVTTESMESIADLPLEVVEEDPFDLRHLDLAVSRQNISDLTTTYAYLSAPSPCPKKRLHSIEPETCTSLSHGSTSQYVSNHGKWKILTKESYPGDTYCSGSLRQLPPRSVRNGGNLRSIFNTNNNNKYGINPRSSATLPMKDKSSRSYVNSALSEDDIDYYYKVIQKKILDKNSKKTTSHNGSVILLHKGKNESMV